MRTKKLKKIKEYAPVESYKHQDQRLSIPTQELSEFVPAEQKRPKKTTYKYDPSLDPQLIWAGKEEKTELNVDSVPIYIQEKISPEAIIAKLREEGGDTGIQYQLFGDVPDQSFNKIVDFYKHNDNWRNRLILGDSLQVMNSLLEKEGMREKVQMVYIDPPYGIRFGSNWQNRMDKREVKDGKDDDLIRQPEQIKAYRDTWELGIHSYLTYLKDRILLASELLSESGSCFVQISDENVHLVRSVLDEVFGSNNFISLITFKRSSGFETKYISNLYDYVIWYAKDSSKMKYRQLYLEKNTGLDTYYDKVQLENNEIKNISDIKGQIPSDAKYLLYQPLVSSGQSENLSYEIDFNKKKYFCGNNRHWKTTKEGMNNLMAHKRIYSSENTLKYIRYHEDYPVTPLTNNWDDTVSLISKEYVVQTNTKVIERCLLMTTDTGDLVLDPTCGSGTTAFVAEEWGRRWTTIDTSRVALSLARARILTAKFPYFRLKNSSDLRDGFEYKTVPHITLGSIANNEDPEKEILYDQPTEDKTITRVSGPFTVESLSPHRVSDEQEMVSSENFVQTVKDNLLKAGVQTGIKEERLMFENLDIIPSEYVHLSGEYQENSHTKRVAIAVGPEYGSVDDDFIASAAKEAVKHYDLLVIAATSYDGSAFTESGPPYGEMKLLKVKINPDLSMGDLLKKTGSGNLFMTFGEPDISIKELGDNQVQVTINGIDMYDATKGIVRSSGTEDIAAWFIDTNYNGESFFVCHAYFLGNDKPYEKLKKALKAEINEEAWQQLYTTTSRPFIKPLTSKIAIKVINYFGDEVMKISKI
ncbi:MAG: adenine specific DNA methylase Mod [Candidatus Gottesmanbacteria bacterium GW2011_GWA2_43_14]|uniref:Adenine specific DNA methylase Mod n=1 Tax=Candidatus Gottesmanbacteria bacterium GW2011_GWA2_43_14 TaxID=1618443 RepID=A0A0G1FMZ1_9BACT|nr:MAG: adenine specific DNA methylase Mod [Candidatus Gottesmanbacteria bacterium GW2011_GWA2_43_14]